MTTRAYLAEQVKTLDLAMSVARISERLALRDDAAAERDHGLPTRYLTNRRHRRAGGHLRLVGDTDVPVHPVAGTGPLRVDPRNTA